jgi:hypothetical protein
LVNADVSSTCSVFFINVDVIDVYIDVYEKRAGLRNVDLDQPLIWL